MTDLRCLHDVHDDVRDCDRVGDGVEHDRVRYPFGWSALWR